MNDISNKCLMCHWYCDEVLEECQGEEEPCHEFVLAREYKIMEKNLMSDDLISRKAVVDLINKLGYINVSNHDDFRANCRMDKIRQEVSELPTSFDKEKVIEELKEQIELVSYNPTTAGRYIKKDRVIKIVEKGGIE